MRARVRARAYTCVCVCQPCSARAPCITCACPGRARTTQPIAPPGHCDRQTVQLRSFVRLAVLAAAPAPYPQLVANPHTPAAFRPRAACCVLRAGQRTGGVRPKPCADAGERGARRGLGAGLASQAGGPACPAATPMLLHGTPALRGWLLPPLPTSRDKRKGLLAAPLPLATWMIAQPHSIGGLLLGSNVATCQDGWRGHPAPPTSTPSPFSTPP